VGVSKLRGHESLGSVYVNDYMTKHGRLPWRVTKTNKKIGQYTTIYFKFVNTACVYKKSPNNLELAFRRQTCVREPDKPGLHETLVENHKKCALGEFTTRRFRGLMWKAMKMLRTRLHVIGGEVVQDKIQDMVDLAHCEHIKKKLRLNALYDLDNNGMLLHRLLMHEVRIKIKCPEKAKSGNKYPRTIGDFTTEGSLLGGHVTPVLKSIFSSVMKIDGGHFMFVEKPDPEVILSVFQSHQNAHHNVFTFHSDDNVATVICAGGLKLSFNLDISSCDISNGVEIFDFLRLICVDQPLIYNIVCAMIEQCRQKCQIRNPYFPKEKFRFETTRPIEYSGSQLTTVLNNIASLLISLSIHYHFTRNVIQPCDAASAIAECAKSIGYIVTVEQWSTVHDSQFLKYSFDGEKIVYNMGPLVRSLGTVDGDVAPICGDKKATIEEKFEHHIRGVLLGTVAYGSNSIINALRMRFGLPSLEQSDDEHLIRRYGLNAGDIEGVCSCIREIKPGMYINNRVIHKILAKDYGYDPP